MSWCHRTIRAGPGHDDPRWAGRTAAVRCGSCAAPSRSPRSNRSVTSWPRDGIDHVGVASAEVLSDARDAIHDRIAGGLDDGMGFTFRNPDRSTDPSRAVEHASSIIVAARSYLTDVDPAVDAEHAPRPGRALRLDRSLRPASGRAARRGALHPARRSPCRRVRRRQLGRRPRRGAPRRPRVVRQERQPAPARCRQLVRPGIDRHHGGVRAHGAPSWPTGAERAGDASTAVRPAQSSLRG